MAFMQPEYTNEPFYDVTNTDGDSWLVPAEGFKDPDPSDFADYIEYGTPEEIEIVTGWFARLSAPGYMDKTDWTGPFKTKKAAMQEIEDLYDVDPKTGDELEENPRRKRKAKKGRATANPKYNIHLIQFPVGTWGFVGNVPGTLALVTKAGKLPTLKQFADARQVGPKIAGLKTRSWKTRTAAVRSAKGEGYGPAKDKTHGFVPNPRGRKKRTAVKTRSKKISVRKLVNEAMK